MKDVDESRYLKTSMEYINEKMKKANKGINVIKTLNSSLPPFFSENNLQFICNLYTSFRLRRHSLRPNQ